MCEGSGAAIRRPHHAACKTHDSPEPEAQMPYTAKVLGPGVQVHLEALVARAPSRWYSPFEPKASITEAIEKPQDVELLGLW